MESEKELTTEQNMKIYTYSEARKNPRFLSLCLRSGFELHYMV